MKKYLLLLLFAIAGFGYANAQNKRNEKEEKIQALKIAFLTQKLQLSPTEAEKFWPVYNEYELEIKNIRNTRNENDVLENEQKLLNIRKKYKPKFEKILGPNKYNALYNAEREFRNVLIKRLKTQRQKRSG